MKTIDIRNSINLSVFTHEILSSLLKGSVSNINEKISNLVKNGDILRLKRGIYCFSKPYLQRPIDLISSANMLYSPSYISFDYALGYYGMIPERVDEITSATNKNTKLFETAIGRFSYIKIPQKVYSLGVDWFFDENDGGRFIATPEKALCDKIRYDRGIGSLTQTQMLEYLKYDLRIELHSKLDSALIETIAEAYKSKNLKTLVKVLDKGKF